MRGDKRWTQSNRKVYRISKRTVAIAEPHRNACVMADRQIVLSIIVEIGCHNCRGTAAGYGKCRGSAKRSVAIVDEHGHVNDQRYRKVWLAIVVEILRHDRGRLRSHVRRRRRTKRSGTISEQDEHLLCKLAHNRQILFAIHIEIGNSDRPDTLDSHKSGWASKGSSSRAEQNRNCSSGICDCQILILIAIEITNTDRR